MLSFWAKNIATTPGKVVYQNDLVQLTAIRTYY